MKLLNKILLVTFMKIVEISTIVYLPYFIGQTFFTKILPIPATASLFFCWFRGVLGIILTFIALFLSFIVFYGILIFINFNWKLVNNGKGIKWIDNFSFWFF